MRKETDLCLLCRSSHSTQRNSHIIPKSFGHGIFYGTSPRHAFAIGKGRITKVQDTIKENYILCPVCEKGLSLFERYCLNQLKKFDLLNHRSIERYNLNNFEYYEDHEFNKQAFNLFIYSIIWRLSISSNYAFENFKLKKEDEEILRNVIRSFISRTEYELFIKLSNLNVLPEFSHVMIRPKKFLRPPSSMYSASSLIEKIHLVFLVDYILFFFADKHEIFDLYKLIDNNNLDANSFIRIGLAEPSSWKEYNYDMIKKWNSRFQGERTDKDRKSI